MLKTLCSKILFLLLFSGILLSCNKKEFLEEKPNTDLIVPATLEDFRALLDNDRIMSETPALGELSADNYYLIESYWNTLNPKEKNAYTWEKDIYNNQTNVGDWNESYKQIFYANVVIKHLGEMKGPGKDSREGLDLFGTSYFLRAYAYHNLAQVFAPVYDPNISVVDNALGLPIRNSPNINENPGRATVKQTYDTIIHNLHLALVLLQDNAPTSYLNRPSRSTANALMARVYLSMGNYDSALIYADRCLSIYSSLLNYNGIPNFSSNPELLYQSKLLSTTNVLKAFVVPACIVDSTLYRSYAINDLRRNLYFTGNPAAPNLKIGYSGSIFMFSGLAIDEVYLIKAESLIRTGNYTEGMNVLNMLLQNRYDFTSFVPLTAINAEDALDKILSERRKELVFRGLRWSDIKRFNKDGAGITLTRKLGIKTYELPPNPIWRSKSVV